MCLWRREILPPSAFNTPPNTRHHRQGDHFVRNYEKLAAVSYTTTQGEEVNRQALISEHSIANLQFLTFSSGRSTFSALIDSGSQLNLISHLLLPFLPFTNEDNAAQSVRGVSGKTQAIQRWVSFPVAVSTGKTYFIKCAVVDRLPCVFSTSKQFIIFARNF